jgi:hypothetical protein
LGRSGRPDAGGGETVREGNENDTEPAKERRERKKRIHEEREEHEGNPTSPALTTNREETSINTGKRG